MIGTAVVVAALWLAGLAIAIATLSGDHDAVGLAGTPAIGHPITTTYGTFTVVRAETIPGLTPDDLGGVTHGIQNLVLSDSAQVEVAVSFSNAGESDVLVDPAQFRLLVAGSVDPVEPSGSSIRPVRLGPGANLEASLTFVVPQSGNQLSLRYQDPGAESPITVPVGVLGSAPIDPAGGHTH